MCLALWLLYVHLKAFLCKCDVMTNLSKAIRDGKYFAPPHASAWQRSPH